MKTRLILPVTVSLLILVFGAAGVFAAADVDLRVADRLGFEEATLDDGAIVQYIGDLNTSYGASGSGVFDPFVRLQGNKDVPEKGYNSDAKKLEFDTKSGTWTHAIKLSEIPTIEVGG